MSIPSTALSRYAPFARSRWQRSNLTHRVCPRPQTYEAEAVVGEGKTKGQRWYKVKWVGYDDDENTEEPASRFEAQCPDLVAKFKRRKRARTQAAEAELSG